MRAFASINNGAVSDDLFATDDDIAKYVGRSALTAVDAMLLLATHRPVLTDCQYVMFPSDRFTNVETKGDTSYER